LWCAVASVSWTIHSTRWKCSVVARWDSWRTSYSSGRSDGVSGGSRRGIINHPARGTSAFCQIWQVFLRWSWGDIWECWNWAGVRNCAKGARNCINHNSLPRSVSYVTSPEYSARSFCGHVPYLSSVPVLRSRSCNTSSTMSSSLFPCS